MPNSGKLAPTWAQLEPNWGPMAQLGHAWIEVGLRMRNLVVRGGIWRRRWVQDRPNVGNMALHPDQSKKTLDLAVRTQVFSAAEPGPGLPPKAGPTVGPGPKLCLLLSWRYILKSEITSSLIHQAACSR